MSASAAAEAGRNLIAADRCFMHQLREWREADEGTRERLVSGVGRRLFWIGWVANGIGALVIVGAIAFLLPIFFDPDRVRSSQSTSCPGSRAASSWPAW